MHVCVCVRVAILLILLPYTHIRPRYVCVRFPFFGRDKVPVPYCSTEALPQQQTNNYGYHYTTTRVVVMVVKQSAFNIYNHHYHSDNMKPNSFFLSFFIFFVIFLFTFTLTPFDILNCGMIYL